jgi:hypothetical protein
VFLVLVGARLLDVEDVGLVDVHPDRRRPLLPLVEREGLLGVGDRARIAPSSGPLAEEEDVLGQAHARERRVGAQLLVEQAVGLGPLHLGDRALPDRRSRVVLPPDRLVGADEVAREVAQPGSARRAFVVDEVLAVDGAEPARLGDPEQLADEEP